MGKKKIEAEYNIGLDVSINGIGWSIINQSGKLLRNGRHHLWGASLFDEAQTAKERRNYRIQRRNKDRRKARIKTLQNILWKDIEKADPQFVKSLAETSETSNKRTTINLSKRLPEFLFLNGTVPVKLQKNNLPIYMIRNELANTKEKADIRYIYLAVAHILKSRGHFIFGDINQEQNQKDQAEATLDYAIQKIAEKQGIEIDVCIPEYMQELLEGKEYQDTGIAVDKKAAIMYSIDKVLHGEKIKIKHLLSDEEGTLSLEDMDSCAIFEQMEEDNAEILMALNDVYQWLAIEKIKKEKKSISEEMRKRYEQHKQDLKELKTWVKKFRDKNVYNKLFHDDSEPDNYNAYTKSRTKNSEYDGRSWNHCTQEQFYSRIKKIIKEEETGQQEAEKILAKMYDENGNTRANGFLPLQRTIYNRTISNIQQTNELIEILNNQAEYYKSIRDNKEKIIGLCQFKIPYYVGPLRQDENSPFKPWIKYSKPGRTSIKPWNFSERINIEKTAQNYIENIIGNCNLLPGKKVLPLHSIVYEEFTALNELNSIRINGEPIKKEVKEKALKELFGRYKRVTDKLFVKWLKENGMQGEIQITLANGDAKKKFKTSMNAKIAMEKIFKKEINTKNENIDIIETIIKWATIYTDRKIYAKRIKETFKEIYSKEIIDALCNLKFNGWGKYSKELLTDKLCIYYDPTIGNEKTSVSVVEYMHKTSYNFSQIYRKSATDFRRRIHLRQARKKKDYTSKKEIEEMTCSPALKRAIWRSVRIINELIDYMGKPPMAIYIRNVKDKNQRNIIAKTNKARKEIIRELYETYEKETNNKISGNLKATFAKVKGKMTDIEYLYFLQMGKCMYTGKDISLNELDSYKIDYILPLSLIPDTSINNMVLIASDVNIRKTNEGIPDYIVTNMFSYWEELNKHGFMTGTKLKKLTTTEYQPEMLRSFADSQFTQTSQISNAIINIMRQQYKNKIHVSGISMKLIELLRREVEAYYVPDLNDAIKAYNAFLTAHIGTFADYFYPELTYEAGYTSSRLNRILKESNANDKNGIIITAYSHDMDDSRMPVLAWDRAEKRKEYIKQVNGWHDAYFTNMPMEYNGKFYTDTIYRKEEKSENTMKKGLIPLNKTKNDTSYYGGYTKANTAYIVAIRYNYKNKQEIELINIPVYVAYKAKKEKTAIIDYLHGIGYNETNGYKNVKIIKNKILLNQEILYKNHPYYLNSAAEIVNAKQAFVRESFKKIIWISMVYSKEDVERNIEKGKITIDEMINAAIYLAKKSTGQFNIYRKFDQSLEKITEKIPEFGIEQLMLLIKVLVYSLSTHKIHALALLKQYNAKEKLGLEGDTRISNKHVHGEITLIHKSITGLYEKKEKITGGENEFKLYNDLSQTNKNTTSL